MIRIAAALGAPILLLAACAPSTPTPSAPPAGPPARPEASTPHHGGGANRDECGAREHRSLIGKPRSKIPVPVEPALQRVACTTCPVTLDYVPRRLNFFFDAETGEIREVKCG